MIKRTCPACGTVNYSADSLRDWICCQCGARIKRTAGMVKDKVKENSENKKIRRGFHDKARD